MYFLDGTLVCHLSICQIQRVKLYVFPRWSTCLPDVYMPESKQKMICIAYMVHLSASCLYVSILTGSNMYCLYGPLFCQLSICHNPDMK